MIFSVLVAIIIGQNFKIILAKICIFSGIKLMEVQAGTGDGMPSKP